MVMLYVQVCIVKNNEQKYWRKFEFCMMLKGTRCTDRVKMRSDCPSGTLVLTG